MTRYINDGFTRVTWAPSVANKNAPTVAEADAGIDLECHLTKDGLNVTVSNNEVDDGALCEVFDAKLAGSYSVSAELTMKRRTQDDSANDPWTFFTYKDQGFLIVREGLPADTAYAAAQNVVVYPAEVAQKSPLAPAQNTQARMMTPFMITSAPGWDAVVAA